MILRRPCAGGGKTAPAAMPSAMPTKAPTRRPRPSGTCRKFYPIDALEEAFIESIDTGHPGMPVFLASPQQIADILEYIYSVMD